MGADNMKKKLDIVKFYEQLEFWKEEAADLGLKTSDIHRLAKRKTRKNRREALIYPV